jgi:hypothetical protein
MSKEIGLKRNKESIWYGSIIPPGYIDDIKVSDVIEHIEKEIDRCEKELYVYGAYSPNGTDDLIEVQRGVKETVEYLLDCRGLLSLWYNIGSNIEDGWELDICD